MRVNIAKSSTKTSVTIVAGTEILETTEVTQRTPRRLKILLPTTFPITISLSRLSDAIIEVASSGRLVPKAMTVRPITDSLTQKLCAIV